jgi:hypothetical protein
LQRNTTATSRNYKKSNFEDKYQLSTTTCSAWFEMSTGLARKRFSKQRCGNPSRKRADIGIKKTS